MTYIKRLVMKGFKSFARKTELPFTPEINVIVGPNGSGKSNITDALCFVLGRLSMKSLRAAKAKNLIFLGNKAIPPSKEASVEIILDNSDKSFSIKSSEVSIKRIVRKNGQSTYKINGETKTRQEVLSLLAQAGIDPYGFNIILQGEIQNFVRMHTEERRKIIESVAGISVYETRKEKALRELEKADEKLKEVSAVLRERTAYLNNLEKERRQAMRFKKLKKYVKILKASILKRELKENQGELKKVQKEIEGHTKKIQKLKENSSKLQHMLETLHSQIESIRKKIEESTGFEQERLNSEIADLRAELAGLEVRLDNSEKKLAEIRREKEENEKTSKKLISEIRNLQTSSPQGLEKTEQEIESKKKELERLELERKKFYSLKSELKSTRDRINDKKRLLSSYSAEIELLIKQSKSLSDDIFYKDSNEQIIDNLKSSLEEKKSLLEKLHKREIILEKASSANESEVEELEKLIKSISEMDICPVCKSKITEQHVLSIKREVKPKIDLLRKQIKDADKELSQIYSRRDILTRDINQIEEEISKRELDLIKLTAIRDKKEQIKALQEKIEKLKFELKKLEGMERRISENLEKSSDIEKKCETVRIEIEELSARNKENLNAEIAFKKREYERARISLKHLIREEEDILEEISELRKLSAEKKEALQEKKRQDEELNKKFNSLLSKKEILQKKAKEIESALSNKREEVHEFERRINELKIEEARIGAAVENLREEFKEFEGIETIGGSKETLLKKLNNAQEALNKLGTVNLRALEVYEGVKKEYDSIKEKMQTIEKEKESVLKIIHEIDIKKKKTFIRTMNALNEIFSRNFSQLSTKGQVFLELENKKDPFAGGVNVIVKTGHGKYFDVTSLSGGEQTLVALSLIFAIQELNPYCFYILDEIDAALDKRNSERLANLLKKYMQKGQYIVITHNDEIIASANNLYGVSMHEGISKIVSLKL